MAWKPGLTKVFVVTHYYDSELTVVGVYATKKAAQGAIDRIFGPLPGGTRGHIAIHASVLEY